MSIRVSSVVALALTVASASAFAATGTLRVTSVPRGAEVWVDGEFTGRSTPARLVLEEGAHVVTLYLPGGGWEPATETVTVEPGRNSLRVTLVPLRTDRLEELGQLLGVERSELKVPSKALLPASCIDAKAVLAVGGAALGEVIGLFGREALSAVPRFVVAVRAQDATLSTADLVGQDAQLFLSAHADGGELGMSGIVTRAGLAGTDGVGATYVVELEATLARLSRVSGYTIYQDLTTPEVVHRVFESADISAVFALVSTYAPSELQVQYDETSLDFVHRLMEHEGIFYFVENDGDVRVGDSNAVFSNGPTLAYRGHFAPPGPGEVVASSFGEAQALVSRTATVAGYDPNTAVPLFASASSGDGLGELFDFMPDITDGETADRQAAIELQRVRVTSVTYHGTSNAPGARPGRFVSIAAAGAPFSGSYLVTGVTHTLTPGDFGCFDYGNRFEAIPADVAFRPQRTAPQPKVMGLLPAVVMEVDPFGGRARVKFPWDRQGEGAWARIAFPTGRGDEHFRPEIEDEVVVGFVEGDPDRPIIIGALWNGGDPPPLP